MLSVWAFLNVVFLCFRIPQKLRISGSLTVILVVFLVTAVVVKVELAPLHFFVLTMVKIVCINCECLVLKKMHSSSEKVG